ncbi:MULTISPECIES: hypothetical protein [unclassified Mycobacterium]|uniref:hypothetical protein n=1 Tax=unclassified Mycobacterium TaxID=2642494 RepID=UPI00073FAD0B|nr:MULTISPECIES: hypothetical protein [unclassified Mycobacterium]KUH81577.1 hypothetical protein AU185_17180 [Mycobacterium sp. GA-0227b]KUH83703.1 hypothetical protein AU186_16875 [Mycobacterium sp. GA-1999]KUH84792.1 hypothetical protein AU187_19965 [Mycobacterium sp. IS-1556]
MHNIVKRASAGAVMGGSLLFTAGLGIAQAQPLNLQDGLVNVAVGDVTILEDVNVGVAANVAAAICGLEVGPVNVLAESVDADGGTETVCDVTGGPINLTQNAGTPGQSGQAPGGGPAQAPGNPTPGGPAR